MKHLKPKTVPKVWGEEIWMVNTKEYCGKKLILRKGMRCSLHYHKKKDETFYIQSGKVLMEYGDSERVMFSDESIRIKPEVRHRFSGLEDSLIIELSTHHNEADSYRVEGELSGNIPEQIKKKYGIG